MPMVRLGIFNLHISKIFPRLKYRRTLKKIEKEKKKKKSGSGELGLIMGFPLWAGIRKMHCLR